ncbi:hypothetical protein LP7551_05289 [Roseibium album]|nr:hypothetical protein LP7551_05289 [Roseibium album]
MLDKTAPDEAQIDTLFEVLQNQTTLENVRGMLRDKGLPHSASSWHAMFERRLQPGLKNGKIEVEEIVQLISESEEHGHKHVLFFQYDLDRLHELEHLFDSAQVEKWAKSKQFPGAGDYVFEAYPDKPTVTEVRVGDGATGGAFVLKTAQTLKRKRPAERKQIDGVWFWVANEVSYRAVDVLKVHDNGLIEIRVHTRSDNISYSGAALSALNIVHGLFNTAALPELSLKSVKVFLSAPKNKDEVSENFEVYEANFKNDQGDRMQSSSLQDRGGILSSKVMPEVIDQFSDSEHDPYCERVRVSYKMGDVKKINIILTENANEIITTSNLSRDEYEEVLGALLKIHEAE